jgi:hypothetical protein
VIKHRSLSIISVLTLICSFTLLLFGCGGGEGSGTTGANGIISGAAVKGPISGGTVTAYAITNGTIGKQLASVTTDSQGNYNISIGDYAGSIILQMSGGTYVDEATGATVTMAPGDVMTAVMTSLSTGTAVTGIQITPLTSMAQAMAYNMAGGMTDANIAAANAAIGNYFMVSDILHTQPMNPLVLGSGTGANQNMRNYGISIAAMTQYAANIGMTSPSGIVTSMMNDAWDGTMNGMMGGTQIIMGGMGGWTMMQPTAGTSSLATAMMQFMLSAMNRSGLTISDMQTLIDQLSTCSGQIAGTGVTSAGGVLGGTAFNGAVSGAMLTAYAANYGMMGGYLSSGTTDSHGNFIISLGTYSGPVVLHMMGGTYTDLATGATKTMSMGNVMSAAIPTVSSGETVTGIQVTPLTSMAQARAQYMTGGMTAANITSANTAVGNYFSVGDILRKRPMNPLIPGSGDVATQDTRNYGMAIAAMSQYAKDIGIADSSAIVTAMMRDASDGIMNGMIGSTQIKMGGMMGGGMMGDGGTVMQSTAGTSGLATAMTMFMGSTANKSGLSATDMQILINTLAASNGTIQ